MAADIGLGGKIEVWNIEKFLATNVYELSFFRRLIGRLLLRDWLKLIMGLLAGAETDPNLRLRLS